MDNIRSGALPALARLLLAYIFILSGWGKLTDPAAAIGYITHVGLPFPQAALVVSIIVELGGGLFLLAGFQTRLVAAVLAVFCLVTAVTAHYEPGDMGQMINFMKNIAMAGGFLQVVAFGGGIWSIDAMRRRVGGSAHAAA